ncbi:hypothetical protein NO991_00310 [Pseudoalteromonas sp. DY56-GL22]|uniref:hypothetical protein n=1 Tax=Pseudoalteromonas sp. DY56-GL22 TaxID=2967126 RepID=UPI003529F59E
MQLIFNEIETILKSKNHLKRNSFSILNTKNWKMNLAIFLIIYIVLFFTLPFIFNIKFPDIFDNILNYSAVIFFITPVICLFIRFMIETYLTLQNPSHDFFKPIMKDISLHIDLVNKFSTFPSCELSQSIRRLSYDIERVKGRLGFLVGAIEKLGIIPYCITLYFAFINFLDKHENNTTYIYALAFLFGLYSSSIVIIRSLEKLEFIKVILVDAYEVAEQREKYEIEKTDKKA